MSVIQVEDLVLYQLRSSYLNEVADGVGERLFTLNENFLNSAPFKSAGWRPNPALIKRTHSPPIPTAIASEYFQAPRVTRLSLEDEGEEGNVFAGGGADAAAAGLATKRRRRREQMEEDDSSDLSDESDDEPDQRAAQQIKFAKMPLRNRSGSSPLQSSNLRPPNTAPSPRAAPRRGSQSALETVKERARRDTVTSSEVSSENEFDASGFHKHREAARLAARAAKLSGKPSMEPAVGVKRQESDLLEEEEEEEDSDASDMSSAFLESIDSTSVLDAVKQPINASPRDQVVGTPPREFTRRSTIRRSAMPAPLQISIGELPPPRPMSTIRPISMMQPKSLLSAALKAKKTKPALPFDSFASLSGQGDPNPITLRIYAPFSKKPSTPFEVLIRRTVHEGEGGDRSVTVADLIGLSLWRYNEEKLEPPLPNDKLNVNWWTLRMVEEDGEVDDDFPPLERKKPLVSFTTANNRAVRGRANSKVYDMFALAQASQAEFTENQKLTPQFEQEDAGEGREDDTTPRNTPKPENFMPPPAQPRDNPLLNTTYRANTSMFADMPQPAQPTSQNMMRGEKKLLRVHIHSSDIAPGQMVTLDVTTETWLADVLDIVCRKRQLDKANHVLKLPSSGTVILLDRTVNSLGNVSDIDLYRRRFATDGPLTMTGSPSSSSPRPLLFADNASWNKSKKTKIMGTHPLAKEVLKQDELAVSSNYKKYTVWRKQAMRLMSERLFAIDGEYVHIMPASGGKMVEGDGKTTTVHFSNVVGCKVSRKHPTNFKLVVFKSTETKRYDFVTNSAEYAADIVQELKKGISPYRDV
ncbi:stress-activated map kinase interacting protein 1-domain-containing protein [Immersiella caudata]|uniref:Stress-activated map kinase interacting protein 1-domain-containing protein n=1 Tax=Immersiella caudata TaxID=314043 RepID=A0AA40C2Y0_9PEZI|nr:stress-activated map kinase interacting protein 1-domain-containing protein [Immersiella caudata]